MKAKVVARELLNRDLKIVPLFPKQKATHDVGWQNKKYQIEDILDDSNIGVNLHQSNLLDVDLETEMAMYFAKLYLSHTTLILGRHYPNGPRQWSHFFFENSGLLDSNITLKWKNETIVELRSKGQTVVYGSTPLKDNPNVMVERYWQTEYKPKYEKDIIKLINKIFFCAIIVRYNVGGNQGALKLDSCLMRYTEWSDNERAETLLDILKITDPNSRDCNIKKCFRLVKCNNEEKKNAGYTAFANHIGADPKEIKQLFSYIGDIPESDNYERVESIRDFNVLALDMNNLMTTEIPPLKHAIKPILPEGFIAIAGRPKAMKSWTALKIAYDVQNGNKFLGHDVEQGDVLYFALEDSQRRIKDRVLKLGYERKKHPQILLANDVPYLKYGFETCITNWIESKQNPRLIIIDTLARIKPRVARNSGTAYDQDNELLSGIQKIAIQNNITVAFITHLSKASTDYSFDKIQGSVGIQGMTDAMWLIDRGDNTNNASIVGRGRDINDFEYAVKWNADTWCYDFTGNLEIVKKTENRLEVINAMKELSVKQKEIAPRDICKHYGFTSNSKDGKRISKTMQRMLGDSELIKGNKYGTYIYMEPSSNY